MGKSLVLLFGIFVSLSAHAALPPQFDADKWQQLVAKAAQSEHRMDSDFGQFRILSRLSSQDPNVTHQADYFSAVGAEDTHGQFFVSYISAVSEFWQINEQGIRDVDQWIYKISTDGQLVGLSHNHLVEDADGRVLVYDGIRTGGADDPTELKRWGLKLTEWTATEAFSLPSLN